MRIDIAMTAALRPEIVRHTLESIRDNLKYDGGFNLWVDVAPVGDNRYQQNDVVNTINNTVRWPLQYRAIEDSPQADALKWTWESTGSEYILQWEDDWILDRTVDLSMLLAYMDDHPWYGMMYFDRQGKSVLDYPGYKGSFTCVSEKSNIWERKKGKSLGGPPAILSQRYVRDVLPLITGNICLDLLSKEKTAQKVLQRWGTCVFTGHDGKGHLVRDTGKYWRAGMGLKMVKNTKRGVTWIKK